MSALKKVKWTYVVLSLFLIALGVCIFVWPEITANTLCVAIGAAALLFGILKLISYFTHEVRGVGVNYDFSVGAMCVIGGGILLIHPADVVALLRVVIGVYLLMDSVMKLQTALDSKRLHVPGWWITLVFSAVCIVIGIMLIYDVETILFVLIAIALIVDGLQNLCMVIFSAVAARAIEKAEQEARTAAEAVEVEPTPAPEPAAPQIPAGDAVQPPIPDAPIQEAPVPETPPEFDSFGTEPIVPMPEDEPAAPAATETPKTENEVAATEGEAQ